MKGTALITGGARRVGRELAVCAADMGFSVAITYNTSEQQARETASLIRSRGVKCELFKCDMLIDQDRTTLISSVHAVFPDLNLLINNASIFERSCLLETDTDCFDRHFTINFKAPFFLTRDFAEICGKGHVINMLDTKIAKNIYRYCAYTISKKALADFTKMAAKELAPHIRVNGIAPGPVLAPDGKPDDYLDSIAHAIPLGRSGDTESITRAAEFLIQNRFVTGQILFVDGGQNL